MRMCKAIKLDLCAAGNKKPEKFGNSKNDDETSLLLGDNNGGYSKMGGDLNNIQLRDESENE